MKKLKNAIALIIKNDDGKVFVVRRALNKKTFPGNLSLPVINLNEGESFEDAANRIARNKLGLESVSISTEPVAVSSVVERPNNLLKIFDYSVVETVGEYTLNSDDYLESMWMTPGELLEHVQSEHGGIMGECTRNFLKSEGLIQ